MNTKNFFIGGITGGIVFFLLGWLFYGHLLTEFFHNNESINEMPMEKFKWWALILGNIFSGLLLAYVFTKSGISTASSGLVTGGIIGFLMASAIDLVMFGTTMMLNKNSLMADIAVMTVISAIAGAVIGAVIGMLNKTDTATRTERDITV
jgi:phosphate/sulfate permease